MAAKGLTRKITRKQALSYTVYPNPGDGDDARPNPIGVTAIASVANGRRKRSIKQLEATLRMLKAQRKARRTGKAAAPNSNAYSSRYAQSRAILGAPSTRSSHAARANGGTMRRKHARKRVKARRSARRNMTARELNDAFDAQMSMGRSSPTSASSSPAKKKAKKRKMTPKQRRALAKARAVRMAKLVGKRYGKYKSLPARIGKTRRSSYAYRDSKTGRVKKIPLHAILGKKSRRALERDVADDPKLAKRVVAVQKRRARAADRLRLHGDYFTPNRRRRRARRISYRSNPMAKRTSRGRKKGGRKSGAAFKRTAQYRKMQAGRKRWLRACRTAATSKSVAPKRRRRKAAKKTAAPVRRRRRKTAKKNYAYAANRRRRRSRRNAAVAATPNRRRRRRSRRNAAAAATPNRRRRRARRNYKKGRLRGAAKRRWMAKHPGLVKRWGKSRRRRRRARSNYAYQANRRRRHAAPNRRRRHARRNFTDRVKKILAIGAVVSIGFAAHRLFTNLLSEKVLAQVGPFQTGFLSDWRGQIAGLAVALAGGSVAVKLLPKLAGGIATGLAASFVLGLIGKILTKLDQPKVAGYFSAYPDADGVTYHNMNGYGEYMLTPTGEYFSMQGFGQPVYQAAAGYTQAAAGYMQAAAGMGQDVYQAAAGMGEYMLTSAQGVGEYELVPGGGMSGLGYTDEGIMPDTASAERALTIAEAAAGVGAFGDVSMTDTWMPSQVQAPVDDAPQGSRAGIMYGSDGIFGTGS